MRYIPEQEYMDICGAVIHDIASAIARSGMTISEIARGTRMKWGTVFNASQGIPVRIESAVRICHYIKIAGEEHASENSDKI